MADVHIALLPCICAALLCSALRSNMYLKTCHYDPDFWRLHRCGVQGFISNPAAWRTRQSSSADIRKDFSTLLARKVT